MSTTRKHVTQNTSLARAHSLNAATQIQNAIDNPEPSAEANAAQWTYIVEELERAQHAAQLVAESLWSASSGEPR